MPRVAAPGPSTPVLIRRIQAQSLDNDTVQSQSDTQRYPKSCNDDLLESPDHYYRDRHILLLMTWLLPLVIPVLAVWVRTFMTTGYTVPFDGDHNFLNITPFLLLVDSSSNRIPKFSKERYIAPCLLQNLADVISIVIGRAKLSVGLSSLWL